MILFWQETDQLLRITIWNSLFLNKMCRLFILLLTLVVLLNFDDSTKNSPGVVDATEVHLSEYPRGCDTSAAAQCEYEFLLCKLFKGPANDQATLCNCAKDFYGKCLRLAGVRFSSFFAIRQIILISHCPCFSAKRQTKLER